MGGDQLVAAVAGTEVEARHGDELRSAWSEEFAPMLAEIRAFDGVPDLLTEVARRGLTVVLASSGSPRDVDAYLDLFDGRSLAAAWTTVEDVDASKPEPDLLQTAMAKVGGRSGVLVGDSVWDFSAAGRTGMPGYAIRSGGFGVEELRQSGARAIFDSIIDLHAALDATLLASAG
jgi:phosphoglycolate phosphatase-like HAD superfamily hydrolase